MRRLGSWYAADETHSDDSGLAEDCLGHFDTRCGACKNLSELRKGSGRSGDEVLLPDEVGHGYDFAAAVCGWDPSAEGSATGVRGGLGRVCTLRWS